MAFHDPGKLGNVVDMHTSTLESRDNADNQSLNQREEREVLDHPDDITHEAQAGIQKAEATALIWSRKALYSTYAWYVTQSTEMSSSNGLVYLIT
jgi:hypothetical protein